MKLFLNNFPGPFDVGQFLLPLARTNICLLPVIRSEDLRREIHEALNVVELWNGINDFIFCGKGGEFSTNRQKEQELVVLCLHLIQNCLVYINTLMIQRVLEGPEWQNRLTAEDLRAITPLIYSHVNPYGRFSLDLEERLMI